MKKAMAVLIAVCLLLALAGCGIRQKINEKVTEKITEGIIDKIGGEDVDIDIDGDEVTIIGKDGTEVNFSEGEWPKEKAAALLPEFKKGKVDSVINSDKGCMISINEVKEEDFLEYVEALKNAGFVNESSTFESESSYYYYGSKDDGAKVMTTYNDSTMMVQVELPSEEQ